MRRLPALVAALLLPAAQPVLLGTALSNASRFDGYGASDYLWQQFLRAGDRWRMSDWQC